MALTPGTRLGPYEIQVPLGAGGMGEVYQARDTRLDRTVAIKVLPQHVASDPELKQRFEREAKTLAALSHPHICPIHDVGSQDGIDFLVMEHLEGETLAKRLTRGALPLDQALQVAVQIADALDKAHRKGIVHRDLKPGNIMLTKAGAKLLDFGLAKLRPTTTAGGMALSEAPTVGSPITGAGSILGTFQYMAPEQLEGREADARTDIFAFGAVVYEMVTGKKAFEGKSQASLISAIMSSDPAPMTTLRPLTPTVLDHVVRTCLVKGPDDRWQSACDLWRELSWIVEGGSQPGMPAPSVTKHPSRTRIAWVSVVAVVTLALAAGIVWRGQPVAPPAPETRTEIVTPATDRPAHFALSPDGQQIVFVASGDGGSRLWLRSLATTTAQPLPGTEGAVFPFWAPDSRSIGFFASGALKRLDLGSGAPQILASIRDGRGGTWTKDGVIIFGPGAGAPLMRVSATGGAATAVTTLGPQQTIHFLPEVLPDGQRFLFGAGGAPDTAGIYLGALDGSEPTRLTPADSPVSYLPSGWLLWVRAGTLVAQRLDVANAALVGEPVTIADGVIDSVSVAATGLVAYRGGAGIERQLTWVDRSGTALGTIGDTGNLSRPRVSPDGRRVALDRAGDIWLLDGVRASRFTFDAAPETDPLWSPDGTRIVFRSLLTGQGDLYQKLTSGAGAAERLVASDRLLTPTSWSADGRFLLYHGNDPQTNTDIWVVPMVGDRTPSVFLQTPFRERWGTFSPDGQWVAYHSNESGRMEVYVRPFVPPGAAGTATVAAGGQWQISTAGGISPVWRPDGTELYYLDPAGAMMAVPVTVSGAVLEPGAPMRLFPTRIVGGGVDSPGRQYDVAPDGRFLISTELDTAATPITLLQNWRPPEP